MTPAVPRGGAPPAGVRSQPATLRLRPRRSAVEEVNVRGRAAPPSVGASDFNISRRGARGASRTPTRAISSSSRRASSSPTRAARATPSRCSCAASTRARGRTSSSPSAASPSTRAATSTATATPTRTSSSRSSSSGCASSRVRSIRARATTPSPAAPTTSSGSSSAGSPRSTRRGSFDTQRARCSVGSGGRERAHTFAGAEMYSTAGFGQNRDAQRGSAMGQYEGKLGARGSYRVTAQGYTTHFHSAGVIREDDYASGKIGFYDSYDLSSFAQRGRSPRAATRRATRSPATSRRASATRRSRSRCSSSSATCACSRTSPASSSTCRSRSRRIHAQRGDLIDLDVHELTIGARGCGPAPRHGLRPAAGARVRLLRARRRRGRDAAAPRGRDRRSRTRPTPTSTRSSATSALYADANLHATSWINVRGGVRADVAHLRRPQQLRGADGRAPVDDEPADRPELPHAAGLGPPARAEPADVDVEHRRSCRARRSCSARSQGFTLTGELRTGRPVDRPELHHAGRQDALREHRRVRRRRRVRRAGAATRRSSRARSSSRRSSTRTSSSARPPAATSSASARTAPAGSAPCARRARSSTSPRTSRSSAPRTTTRTCSSRTSPASSCGPTRRSFTSCRFTFCGKPITRDAPASGSRTSARGRCPTGRTARTSSRSTHRPRSRGGTTRSGSSARTCSTPSTASASTTSRPTSTASRSRRSSPSGCSPPARRAGSSRRSPSTSEGALMRAASSRGVALFVVAAPRASGRRAGSS